MSAATRPERSSPRSSSTSRAGSARLGPSSAPRLPRVTSASELPSLRLDAPREEALERAAAIVEDAWRSFDQARPGQPEIDERLGALLRAALPEEGSSVLGALDDAARVLDVSIAQPRPRFFAFVGSSGLEIGVLGDILASCFDVNLAVWAGAASEVEDQAVRWVSEFIRYPAAAGRLHERRHDLERHGARRRARAGAARLPADRRRWARAARSTAPREAHYSVIRSAELLGLGADWVRALPQDERPPARPGGGRRGDRRRPRRRASRRSRSSRPRARRSRAPSTRSTPLADVCAERDVWLHVDGAYGVAAASTPSAGHLFDGARARRLGDARRAQVALPAEGLRRRSRPAARGPPRRARARGGLHPARAARPPHGRHHARVLAAVPRPQGMARVPRARRGGDPRRDRAEPRPGPAAVRGARAPRRPRAALRRAAALRRPVPPRPGGRRRPRRAQRAARPGAAGGRRRLDRARRGSTARSASGPASSTTGRRTTTSARSSSSRASSATGCAPRRPSASSSRSCRSCGRPRLGGRRPASCARASRRRRTPSAAGAGGSSPRASALSCPTASM